MENKFDELKESFEQGAEHFKEDMKTAKESFKEAVAHFIRFVTNRWLLCSFPLIWIHTSDDLHGLR